MPKASLPGSAGPFGGVLNRWVDRLWPAAVKALFQAICGPVTRAPSIRSIASGKPPSSQMQTVCGTPIAAALAMAPATIARASASSSFNAVFMQLCSRVSAAAAARTR